LSETALGRSRLKRRAVQQQLRAGRTQQQSRLAVGGNGGAQFIPGDVKLLICADVVEAVEPRELQQNVEAANEGTGGCSLRTVGHGTHAVTEQAGVQVLPLKLTPGAGGDNGTRPLLWPNANLPRPRGARSTLVSVRRGVLQQWYPLLEGGNQRE